MSTGSPGNVTCQSLTTNVFSNQSYVVYNNKHIFNDGSSYSSPDSICTIPQDGLYQVTVRQILNPNIVSDPTTTSGYWGICDNVPNIISPLSNNFITPVGGDVWLNMNKEIASHFGYIPGFDDVYTLLYPYTVITGTNEYTSANLLFQFTNGDNLYFYAGIEGTYYFPVEVWYSITVRYLSSS